MPTARAICFRISTGNSGFFSVTTANARCSASSSNAASFTGAPSRGFNGLPSSRRIGVALEEPPHRALALPCDTGRRQFINHVLEHRVVETLAERVVKPHAQPPVDHVELVAREVDDLLPDCAIFRIAALKLGQLG